MVDGKSRLWVVNQNHKTLKPLRSLDEWLNFLCLGLNHSRDFLLDKNMSAEIIKKNKQRELRPHRVSYNLNKLHSPMLLITLDLLPMVKYY